MLVFFLTLVASIDVTQASLMQLLDRDGVLGALRLWSGLTDPNFALLPQAIMEAIETIFLAFLATVIAIPLAFILAFFCAKNLMTNSFAASVYFILRLILNVSRSVEPLIWALYSPFGLALGHLPVCSRLWCIPWPHWRSIIPKLLKL